MDIAKMTARTLLDANLKDGVSWRQISKYGLREGIVKIQAGIAPGTLCRFAKSKGTWKPKDIELQKKFGVYSPKHKRIQDMTSIELLWCLNNRKEMQ